MRTGMLAVVLAAAFVIACDGPGASGSAGPTPIALRTQESVASETPAACPAALIEGELVADPASGVGIHDPGGFVRPVIWPHGYSGRPGTPIEVVDADGTVIARVGDQVRIGGGETGADGAWNACGGVTVR